MDERTVKRQKFLINLLYILAILAIAIFICRKAVGGLVVFVIAFIVTLIIKPLVGVINKKLHISRGIASVILTLLFYAILVLLLILLSGRIVNVLRQLLVAAPSWYRGTLAPRLEIIGQDIREFISNFNPQTAESLNASAQTAVGSIGDTLTSFAGTALKALTSYAMSVPKLIVNIVITVVATVFMTLDYPFLKELVIAQMSEERHQKLHEYKVHLNKTLLRYLRSYALIMAITFAELSAGLLLIGIKGAVGIAALIAILDILPILGSGTILIPWFIYDFVVGNIAMGAKIAALYIVITVIRQIIEPKIVGDHVGLHPIITLLSMIVGTFVFGPIGLLGLPITVALLKSMQDEGIIHFYNDPAKKTIAGAEAEKTGNGDEDKVEEKKTSENTGDGSVH